MKTIILAKGLKTEPIHDYEKFHKKQAKFMLFETIKHIEAEQENKENLPVGTKTVVLGSNEIAYNNGDRGFFSTVINAYNNHRNLRTGPEDWWYCFIQKIAVAIDSNSEKENVRKFFVQHEGKKTLTVYVGPSIYGVDYSWFFDQMSQKIAENINVPSYVDTIRAEFSETTKVQKIVSEITLMTSLKQYFEYRMFLCCGIPAVEMKGNENDWISLGKKLDEMQNLLKPITDDIGLSEAWWKKAKGVCKNLLDTYQGNPDKEWWSKIFTQVGFGSGPQYVDGWFIRDVYGLEGEVEVGDVPRSVVSVPMTVTDGATTEVSALIAGIMGQQIHKHGDTLSVEAVHCWAMLLEPDSVFREDIRKWEENLSGA